MRNIKLTIRYDGTNYSGWQFQKNARSIQEAIQRSLKRIVREKVNLVGSGRTDAGVHAASQVANFRTRSVIPLKNIQMALNSILPRDIIISQIEEAPVSFNSQHDARSKLYRYTISNGYFVDPFLRKFASGCLYKLNITSMRKAVRHLKGRQDFKSFQAKGGGERDSVRRIKKIKIEKEGNLVYIYIEADGFLYNMVRNIVGTLIDVGRGKIAPEGVKTILGKKDRRFCGPTAPAKGLCLVKVRY